MHLTERVLSPLSAADVWHRMSDFSNTAAWDPGVLRADALTPGPPRQGSRYRVTVPIGPLRSVMDYEVLSFDPSGQRVVLLGRTPWLHARDDIRVVPVQGGSEVWWDATFTLQGPLRVTEPLWRRGMTQVADAAMTGLAAWLRGSRVTQPTTPTAPATPNPPPPHPG